MKAFMYTLLSLTLAIGTVYTANAAPLLIEDIDRLQATYLSDSSSSNVGATLSLVIASIAIALGLAFKSMDK